MKIPSHLLYTKSHEWVRFLNETTVLIGLTDYAQKSLGDIVFVNLPAEGDAITIGDSFSDVESVKAVSDVYSPVSGNVSKVNTEVMDAPELINQGPYETWLVEVSDVFEQDDLLDAAEYEALIEQEE